MKTIFSLAAAALLATAGVAQNDPELNSWLINTTGLTGRHYVEGNSTPINDTYSANVQNVQYSNDYVYVSASGIPAYIIGPYPDGNPAQGTDREWLWKIPRNPVANSGTLTETNVGQNGSFINGVPMYDYRDVASYSSATGQDEMQGGDGVWNRNAILAENDGFDCAKGHPSPVMGGMPGPTVEGSYHHHQNPTAFNLDMVELSDICDLYLADGLYTIDSTQHSPLIGYAFDGFPVYGAYGYANTDGTGGIKRMETSFQLRNITQRTHLADGTDVTDGPAVSPSFPLGWYREDYEFITGSGDLDVHNGRFCVTPEYPDGIYCYFATVDENWNSAYPYLIGETFYGVVESANFGQNNVTISEPVETYNPNTAAAEAAGNPVEVTVFPNPASDLVAIQVNGLLRNDLQVEMFDAFGRPVRNTRVRQGSTIWHLDTRTLYSGTYIVKVTDGRQTFSRTVVIQH